MSLRKTTAVLTYIMVEYSGEYVVIDALDECSGDNNTHSDRIPTLRALPTSTTLCLTFSPKVIIDIEGKSSVVPSVEIKASDLDVYRFLDGEINKLPEFAL